MNADQNPYASPVDLSSARWDHSLTKRIFYACSAITIFYLVVAAIGSWNSFRHVSSVENATPLEQVEAFFAGWDSLQGRDR